MAGWRQKTDARIARLARFIVRRPWWVIAASTLPILVLAAQLPNVRFDTSTEGFLHPNDPALLDYNAFRDQFGRDDVIVLALQPPRVFDLGFLEKLRALHQRLEAEVPHLDEVTSLINARATRGSEDELLVEDLLEEWPAGPQELPAIEAWVTGNPSYRNLLISEDGRFTTVVIRPDAYSGDDGDPGDDLAAAFDGEAEAAERQAEPAYLTDAEVGDFVAGVRTIVADFDTADFPVAMAGSPVVMDVVKRSMRHDMMRFVRLTIAAIAVFIFLLFRRLSAVFLALMVVLLSLLATIGLMTATGAALKLPTMILPSFLLAVGVGDAVHILALFFRNLGAGVARREAIIAALELSSLPVILTSLTTAGGLLSFAPTSLAPISDLGVFAPIGVMIALLLSLLLLPALLAVVPIRQREAAAGEGGVLRSWIDRVIGAAGDFAATRPWVVIGVAALLLCVAGLGAARIEFSHNPLEWLPASKPVRVATEQIDRELRGSVNMEVVLTRSEENGWYDPAALRALEDFSRFAEQYTNGEVFIGRAFSLVDVLKRRPREPGGQPLQPGAPDAQGSVARRRSVCRNPGGAGAPARRSLRRRHADPDDRRPGAAHAHHERRDDQHGAELRRRLRRHHAVDDAAHRKRAPGARCHAAQPGAHLLRPGRDGLARPAPGRLHAADRQHRPRPGRGRHDPLHAQLPPLPGSRQRFARGD
ncbi:MAG: efflux RND transporter permease subunit, partial [Planctomycetota bacterium]